MPIPGTVRRRVRRFLDPDDDIRYIVEAVNVLSVRSIVLIVVSRKAVTLVGTTVWSRKRPKKVLGTLPRMTRLGPVDDIGPIPMIRLAGANFEIDEEYISVVNAADAEVRAPGGGLPPDPEW